MNVDMEQRARCGEFGCNKAIGVDGDVLCVVNEGLEGLKGVADEGWSTLMW